MINHSERLKGLDVFVAAADAGSFTAAGERLNLTNSAVGKAVARLEERLNKRLFERTTRRLALTDAGLAFYRVCVRVLDELESAERVLAADVLKPSGRLRVDVPTTFGRLRVMSLLLEFAQRHPAVRPHLSFTDRFVDLVEDGIDVAVRIGGPDSWPTNLGHRYMGNERLIFCTSPSYLARRGTPQSPHALSAHDAVMYGRADGTASPWLVSDGTQPMERKTPEAKLVVGHGEAQLAAVVAGCGIAQMATWLADEPLRDGRLVPILDAWTVEGLPLHLVWPLSKQLLPKVDALISHLADHLLIR